MDHKEKAKAAWQRSVVVVSRLFITIVLSDV